MKRRKKNPLLLGATRLIILERQHSTQPQAHHSLSIEFLLVLFVIVGRPSLYSCYYNNQEIKKCFQKLPTMSSEEASPGNKKRKAISSEPEEECGFAVVAKYPIGTRFIRHQPSPPSSSSSSTGPENTTTLRLEHGIEGRVVGFDGEWYQIYYPTINGDCHFVKESDLDQATIITKHKRPSQKKASLSEQPEEDDQEEDDDDILCPICAHVFSSDPADKKSGRLPIQAQHCSHVICMDCVQKIRIASSSSSATSRSVPKTLRSTIDCPLCKQAKSFRANEPTTCLIMCQMVAFHQKIKTSKQQKRARHQASREQKQPQQISSIAVASAAATAYPDSAPSSTPSNSRKRSSTKNDNHRKPSSSLSSSTSASFSRPDTEALSSFSSHNDYCTCTCCHYSKPVEMFSTQQMERAQKCKSTVLCRRCEEKTHQKRSSSLSSSSKSLSSQRPDPAPSSSSLPSSVDPRATATTSHNDYCTCTRCHQSKPVQKFSTQQMERAQKCKSTVLCRRCEEKTHQKRSSSLSSSSKSLSSQRPDPAPSSSSLPSSVDPTATTSHNDYCTCTRCHKSKPAQKFSTRQKERAHKCKSTVLLCRRCEEKTLIRKEVGPGKWQRMELHVAQKHNGTSQFLTTLLPWPLQQQQQQQQQGEKDSTRHQVEEEQSTSPIQPPHELPPKLTVDGYTREAWSCLDTTSTDDHPDKSSSSCSYSPWQRMVFRSTGEKMQGFLSFLKQHKKSAYGTFVLPCGKDGFFVIPFNQPSTENREELKLLECKYVLGLGLVGPNAANSQNKEAETSTTTNKQIEEDYISSSTLGELLTGLRKTDESLAVVPKGSVKAVKTNNVLLGGGQQLGGVMDWFRPRITES